MKIKIISCTCSEQAWYKNRIGEVFEASPTYPWGDWNVGHQDGTGKECSVAYEDAVEMEELRPKPEFEKELEGK